MTGEYYKYHMYTIPQLRCYNCNSLMAKNFDGNSIEIKCRRCKRVNVIGHHTGEPPEFEVKTGTPLPVIIS